MKTYTSVSNYITQADKSHRAVLKDVRKIVRETAPDAEEKIAYGMPAYMWREKPLFYFAAMKGHLGAYPTPGPIQACASKLKNFSTSKGCVRVPYTAPLPEKLIIALLKARVKEIKNMKTIKVK